MVSRPAQFRPALLFARRLATEQAGVAYYDRGLHVVLQLTPTGTRR